MQTQVLALGRQVLSLRDYAAEFPLLTLCLPLLVENCEDPLLE